jgi:hypothetical protein
VGAYGKKKCMRERNLKNKRVEGQKEDCLTEWGEIIGQHMRMESLILSSSSPVLERLLQTLDPRGAFDRETRNNGATIVAHLALIGNSRVRFLVYESQGITGIRELSRNWGSSPICPTTLRAGSLFHGTAVLSFCYKPKNKGNPCLLFILGYNSLSPFLAC